MKLITINIPYPYLDGVKKLIELNRYGNRCEAIRQAVLDFLKRELPRLQLGQDFFSGDLMKEIEIEMVECEI